MYELRDLNYLLAKKKMFFVKEKETFKIYRNKMSVRYLMYNGKTSFASIKNKAIIKKQ